MSEATLEDTPTWIVASVCSVIVLISFGFERALHLLGKALERRRRETLYEALLKLKEELMLLGFISLLLVVFQESIQRICIDERLIERWQPCRGRGGNAAAHDGVASTIGAGGRRLLSGGAASERCPEGKVSLLSLHALEQIHIFIFVLAITHVVLSAVTVLLGLLQVDICANRLPSTAAPKMITRVQKIKFIQNQCKGHEGIARTRILMRSFFKQFYGSVNMDDYVAMRLGFVTLLLLIGAKLEHIINKLAYEVATKHAAVEEGNLVMSPSDELFWFRSPRLVLIVIHFILFQNAFEFAFFIWTLVIISTSITYLLLTATFGVKSCMMDGLGYSVSRIVICVFVQVLCSYSTLPLYAIVTHMGSSFKSAVFADDVAGTSEAGPTPLGRATGWRPRPATLAAWARRRWGRQAQPASFGAFLYLDWMD
ncbi:hypothetical protein PR202_ga20209 [Eleusine coracana subsp. coracana]|uniref:MLO-like protein n=1 Tax=Eleusine coracana subsp. coracana TaxID=191504 RepID=A0AAV5CXL4_ELECO|nr:hypothetical protein PR202_ga20209 [Eleusine coracana subsp. coracana]